MASRPSTMPRWATTGTKIGPTAAFLNEGYDPSEKPPAQVENWFKDLLSQWVGYFDSALGIELFGDGSDGSHTADGTTAIPGCTIIGGAYFQTRDVYFVDLTVNTGIAFCTANYRTFGQGTLTNNGHVHCDGVAATTRAGATATAGGTMCGGASGGAGGQTSSQNGTNAQANVGGQAFMGGQGGTGGAGVYGASGDGNSTGGNGTAVGLSASFGSIRNIVTAMLGVAFGFDLGSMITTFLGGGGGGGGGGYGDNGLGTLASNGGGGAAGAGTMMLGFVNIVNNGSISVDGKQGAPFQPTISTGDEDDTGAGGGSGGGLMWIFYKSLSGTAGSSGITANGGPAGGRGLGPAPEPTAGANGTIITFDLSLGSDADPLAPHKERGLVSFATGGSGPGYDFVDVTFAEPFPDLNYTFDYAESLTSGTDPVPITMVNQTQYGFRLLPVAQFSGRVSWKCETL